MYKLHFGTSLIKENKKMFIFICIVFIYAYWVYLNQKINPKLKKLSVIGNCNAQTK